MNLNKYVKILVKSSKLVFKSKKLTRTNLRKVIKPLSLDLGGDVISMKLLSF